jgi:serpin B
MAVLKARTEVRMKYKAKAKDFTNARTKRIIAVILVLGMIVQMSACGTKEANTTEDNKTTNSLAATKVLSVEYPEAISIEDWEKRSELSERNVNSDEFLQALSQFSNQSAAYLLSNSDKNVAYSPMSLYFALAVLAQGADQKTKMELFESLGISKFSETQLAEEIGKLYRSNYVINEAATVTIANSLWMQTGFPFKQEFKDGIAKDYYAELFEANLSGAGDDISAWVEEKTNGLIKPEIKLSTEAVLAIINTIYFKGSFSSEFNKALTNEAEFTNADGSKQMVDFMHQTFKQSEFLEGENFVAFRMEFDDIGSIVFALPKASVSVLDLVKDESSYADLITYDGYTQAEVNFSVPKFDYTANLDLVDMLQGVGIKSAFEPDADFSKMTEEKIKLSSAIQDVHIIMDETGVEAAAFTMLAMETTSALMPEELPIVEINLNQPFVYAIQNNDGNVLFTGIVQDISK